MACERQTPGHLRPHIGDAVGFRHDKRQIVAIVAPVRTGPFVQKDFGDQVGNGNHIRRNAGRIVADQNQPWLPFAGVVRNIVRPRRKCFEVQGPPVKYFANTVIKLRAHFGRADLLLLPSYHLRQVRFSQKPQWHIRPVVEVGRISDEALARIVYEANIGAGRHYRIPQLFGRQAAQHVVEGERVKQHAARNVRAIGRHAFVMLQIEFLSQRRRLARMRRHFRFNRRQRTLTVSSSSVGSSNAALRAEIDSASAINADIVCVS